MRLQCRYFSDTSATPPSLASCIHITYFSYPFLFSIMFSVLFYVYIFLFVSRQTDYAVFMYLPEDHFHHFSFFFLIYFIFVSPICIFLTFLSTPTAWILFYSKVIFIMQRIALCWNLFLFKPLSILSSK